MAIHRVNCKHLLYLELGPGTTADRIKVGVGILPSVYVPTIHPPQYINDPDELGCASGKGDRIMKH